MTAALQSRSATLLIHCKDQRGLISAVTGFIAENNGNILDLDQHVDAQNGVFFMRVVWDTEAFDIPVAEIGPRFQEILATPYQMSWQLNFSEEVPRMALFVSKLSHCLYDVLSRTQANEWQVEVPVIISNHRDLEPIAERFGIDFHHLPITQENKVEQEAQQLELLREYQVDFVVLARYMQILTPEFIEQFPERIINIHHSFLPAFPGARPYHSAHARGVKIIGATNHYVTGELDAGPIIAQDVVPVSHRDSVEDLIRKGRDLEKLVLARAIWNHINRKVLCYDNRTVILGG